ncbi:hypothetical protein [Lolliginicoccus levis]|uniref:hypothetical protein n=1 Tax=Lolliginicoccus levis TaxID=2919542 RepID=UPI00241E976B|nr:hypothetical protein [Lolliginicoccus levis]
MRQRATSAVLAAALLVVVLGGAAVVGALNPVPPLPVATDVLGPSAGEPIDEYQQRAAATLQPHGGGGIERDEQARWALVLPEQPVDAAAAIEMVAGTRASRLILDGGPDGGTPLAGDPSVSLPAPAPGRDAAAVVQDGVARGVSLLREHGVMRGTGPGDPDAAGIIGVLVRAPLRDLAAIAGRPAVASVEALPADARWGAFAVRAR